MLGNFTWTKSSFLFGYFLYVAFKLEQKEKKESQAVRKRKKGGANATPPSTSSPKHPQPSSQSDTTSGAMNFMKQSINADSASSSQGEEDGSMEVDPVISVQQNSHSPAQLSINSIV